MNRFLYLSLLLLLPWLGHGQILLFQGKVVDERTNAPLQGVEVRTELDATTTDAQGDFELELAMDVRQVTFEFFLEGYETTLLEVEVTDLDVKDLGTISLATMSATTQLGAEELIPTVVLDDNDLDDDAVSQDISGLLTASRDVFVSAAAFTFGPARFRIRGYDSENTTVLMNGVPVNDLENGRVFWGAWGGLNDVTRLRQTDFGLGPIEYAFGGIGGATFIDTRASVQRKQLRASYSSSNRTYRNRLMLTYSTGQLE
ncbi:MAG: carboxypeptidase-like regulatory domain-containing protein, partial [Saprospiraceae bacterium]|nr:carboxypeptidase-like regulatory domain-containing protein [Saprospiraceae bacterium]